MATDQLFDFREMVSLIAQYFGRKGFDAKEHCIHQGMKVHVYASKNDKSKEKDDLIAEIAVGKEIRPLLIGENLGKHDEKVGLLAHFQTYFHPTKIYLVIPYYATNIAQIKELCKWEGIGLLQINENNRIVRLLPSLDRVELFKEVVNEEIGTIGKDKSKIIDKVGKLADTLLIHRAVKTLAYPPPSYQMNLSRYLLEKMTELSDDVIYKKDILDFCKLYLTQRVDDYVIVVDCVKKLWRKHLGFKKIASSFDFYEKFENILLLDKDYRDHLLHQFQVLLLGTLVIDGIFPKYFELYKYCLGNIDRESVYKSWLIASTFHDFAYPLERYNKWNTKLFNRILNIKESPTIIELERITTEKNIMEYLDQIDSLLSCYNSSERDWCCKKPNSTNEDLRRFLLNKIVREKNHGVLSSLALLKKSDEEKTIDRNDLSKIIYPAAVAIAIHDEGIWQPFRGKKPTWRKISDKCKWEEEFTKCNYLNHLDFCNQPLSFLLIYCDTAQEFGRPKWPDIKDDSSLNVLFEDININENKINIIISVDSIQAYEKKEKELNETINFLKSSEIEFCFRLQNKEDKTHRDFTITS